MVIIILNAPELASFQRYIHPVMIVKMQHRLSRYGRVFLLFVAMKSCSYKHASPHRFWTGQLQANFGCADTWVEDWSNVADAPFKHLVRIGIESNVRIFARLDE